MSITYEYEYRKKNLRYHVKNVVAQRDILIWFERLRNTKCVIVKCINVKLAVLVTQFG